MVNLFQNAIMGFSNLVHLNLSTQGDAQRHLAKQIAQRLIQIGDQYSLEADTLTVTEIQDQLLASLGVTNGFSWRSVIQLYRALSRLLSESLNQSNLAESEAWQRFEELWKMALRVMVSWIADNGGWVSQCCNHSAVALCRGFEESCNTLKSSKLSCYG